MSFSQSSFDGGGSSSFSLDLPAIKRKSIPTTVNNSSNSSSCSSLGVVDIHHHDLPLFSRKDIQIGALMGRGRFSQVHAIEHVEGLPEDQNYVMKHLQRYLFQNRTHRRFAKDMTHALADLVLEAMYLSKLNHPNIVSLRGMTLGGTAVLKRRGATEEDYFLILDRMEGTLDQRIQAWKSNHIHPEPELIAKTQYALQVADALNYLHERRIIYRDMKPENLGFDQDGTIKLFDFGLARELAEPPESNRVYTLSPSGTRRYMAVEIFIKGKYNYKADVYSWAMLFYEMLAMAKPFADFTIQSHEELVCRLGGRPRLDEIDWPDDDSDGENIVTLPEDIELLLHQAWHQDPDERLSMTEVCERLQMALDRHAIIKRYQGTGDNDNAADVNTKNAYTGSSRTYLLPHQFVQVPRPRIELKNKESASELTASTDPLFSDDSEQEDGAAEGNKGLPDNKNRKNIRPIPQAA